MKIKIGQLKQIIREEMTAMNDSTFESDLDKLLSSYLTHIDAERSAHHYNSYPIGGYQALDKLKNEFKTLKQQFIQKYQPK